MCETKSLKTNLHGFEDIHARSTCGLERNSYLAKIAHQPSLTENIEKASPPNQHMLYKTGKSGIEIACVAGGRFRFVVR